MQSVQPGSRAAATAGSAFTEGLLRAAHAKILESDAGALLGADDASPEIENRPSRGDGAQPAEDLRRPAAAVAMGIPLAPAQLSDDELRTAEMTIELPLAKRGDDEALAARVLDALVFRPMPGAGAADPRIVVDVVRIDPVGGVLGQGQDGAVRRCARATVRVAAIDSFGLTHVTITAWPFTNFVRGTLPSGMEVLLRCGAADDIQSDSKLLVAVEPTQLRALAMRDRPAAGKWVRRVVKGLKTAVLTFVPEEGSREARAMKRSAPPLQTGTKRKR